MLTHVRLAAKVMQETIILVELTTNIHHGHDSFFQNRWSVNACAYVLCWQAIQVCQVYHLVKALASSTGLPLGCAIVRHWLG